MTVSDYGTHIFLCLKKYHRKLSKSSQKLYVGKKKSANQQTLFLLIMTQISTIIESCDKQIGESRTAGTGNNRRALTAPYLCEALYFLRRGSLVIDSPSFLSVTLMP